MRKLYWAFAIAGHLLSTPMMEAQTQRSLPDSSRAAAFDRLDRKARMLISTVQCARGSAYARATGLFGPPDSLGERGQCLRRGGRTFGVFFTPDSTFSTARQLGVVDLANRVRYSGPVDTTAILNEARAIDDALTRGYPSFEAAQRQFVPMSIRSDGDSIEVWLLPVELFMRRTPATVGGERGFMYSPDGRTLAGEMNALDRHRALAVQDTGRAEIVSQEDDLPLMSELIAANVLNGEGREVQLLTKRFATQLVGRGPNSMWIHVRRR